MKRFTRQQAAGHLGVSLVTIDRLLAKKVLGHYKIGTRVIISEDQLAAFLRSSEKGKGPSDANSK